MSTNRRLRRQRTGDAEPPLVAVRERRPPAQLAYDVELELLEQRFGAPPSRARSQRRRRARRPRRSPAPRARETTRLCWKVRARPCRPRRCGRQRVTSRPSSSTAPVVGEVEAGDDVDERRLAGSVRADEPDHLVPMELERHVPKGLHPLEGTRDRGGPERCSGPPADVLSLRVGQPSDLRNDLRLHRPDDLRRRCSAPGSPGTGARTPCAGSSRS